jgi:hypothetical protein
MVCGFITTVFVLRVKVCFAVVFSDPPGGNSKWLNIQVGETLYTDGVVRSMKLKSRLTKSESSQAVCWVSDLFPYLRFCWKKFTIDLGLSGQKRSGKVGL